MSSKQQVIHALEQFADWAKPWTYIRVALAAGGVAVGDRTLVEKIWEEASASAHWLGPNLTGGADLAAAALKTKYPWLSDGAISNLVRGASYSWR